MSDAAAQRPDGIDGSALPGPFPVGVWAKGFQGFLRERPRVQIFGEVVNLRRARARVYFELRDGDGAAQCSIWANRLDALRLPEGTLADGVQVVVAGGPDYYPGSRTASPSFSFDVTGLRVAGEGDLLAQLAELRRRLEAEGLFLPQQELPRPALPRTIGVVTGEGGKARDDVLAGLRRRGWGGRLVWAFAPVQDRRAAAGGHRRPAGPRSDRRCRRHHRRARRRLARRSLRLQRRDALPDRRAAPRPGDRKRRAPHRPHADRRRRRRQLLHADARRRGRRAARRRRRAGARARRRRALARHGRRAVLERGRSLARMGRVPADHVARHRRSLHQSVRELRAAAGRRVGERREASATRALVLNRKTLAGAGPEAEARRRALESLTHGADRARAAPRARARIRNG